MTTLPLPVLPVPPRSPDEFRGTNYIPSTSRGWLANTGLVPWSSRLPPQDFEGFYSPVHAQAEIDAIKNYGLNNVRFVGSFMGWICDPTGYEASLKDLVTRILAVGMSVTYCIWNTTPWGFAGTIASELVPFRAIVDSNYASPNLHLMQQMMQKSLVYSRGNARAMQENDEEVTQFPEPVAGIVRLFLFDYRAWMPGYRNLIESYLHAITTLLGAFAKGYPGRTAISFDLYNEANLQFASAIEERNAMLFIAMTYRYVVANAPMAPCTVGWAGLDARHPRYDSDLLMNYGVRQDYLSLHAYDANIGMFRANLRMRKQHAQQYRGGQVPVVCSEFWKADWRGRLREYLQALMEEGVGGQMWGFLQSNAWSNTVTPRSDWDGVLRPRAAQSISTNSQLLGDFDIINRNDLQAVMSWVSMAKTWP